MFTQNYLNLLAYFTNSATKLLVSPTILRMLYFAFVHTQLLYGIEIYGRPIAARSHLNKLIILNNKILCIIRNKPIQYCVGSSIFTKITRR